MRLHLNRDHAKGTLGGVRFELRAKVELTEKTARTCPACGKRL